MRFIGFKTLFFQIKPKKMQLKSLIHKKYILYGFSIVFTRGFEMLVLLYAADYLSKSNYGNLEFYKKVIEVGSSFLAFGLPALIVSYTTNKQNKNYFYLLSVVFAIVLSVIVAPVLGALQLLILWVPLLFYALYFTGGITQNYLLVRRNSNVVSLYKILVSILFYSLVFMGIRYYMVSEYAFVYPAYFLIIPGIILSFWLFYKEQIYWHQLKRYGRLFVNLLPSSLTLVVSNFANLMFLYTDIFIIKILSEQSNIDIADYSFSLNIANMLLLVPVTLVQVDIEKLKQSPKEVSILFRKILILVFVASLFLAIFYKYFTGLVFTKFIDTYWLFIIILVAKIFQSFAPVFGTYLAIKRKYVLNLKINLFVLALNVVLSYILFYRFGLYGVAFASLLSLAVRFVLFALVSKKYIY